MTIASALVFQSQRRLTPSTRNTASCTTPATATLPRPSGWLRGVSRVSTMLGSRSGPLPKIPLVHSHRSLSAGFGRCGAGSFGSLGTFSLTVATLRAVAGVVSAIVALSPPVAGTGCARTAPTPAPFVLCRPAFAALFVGVRLPVAAFSASRLRPAHRFQLAGPMTRGHACSIHARSSVLSPARFGIPAFSASRLRPAHRFQLAGPMTRGHARSIHARSSALSPARFGIPAFSASRLRPVHRFQLAGPMTRGHARSIHARSSAQPRSAAPRGSAFPPSARFEVALRSAHRFQLAGPMTRGHARSIHARSSVLSTVKSGASAQSPLAISSALGFSGPAAPVVTPPPVAVSGAAFVSAIATHPASRMAPSAAKREKGPATILETIWLSTLQVLLLTEGNVTY